MIAASSEAACQAERISRIRMLQKELDDARARSAAKELGLTLNNGAFGADCKITRVVATSDLVFPSTNAPQGCAERKIPKGEIVEIIQTSRGKYLRLPRTGDLYAVKAGQPAPDASSTDTPVVTSESGPSTQTTVTTPMPPSVPMTMNTTEINHDGSLSGAESSVGASSQFPCQSSPCTEAAQAGPQIPNPTTTSATTKSFSSGASVPVFPLAKSDPFLPEPQQEVRKPLPAADWSAPVATESKTNMPIFPAMAGQFFGHELLGLKSSSDPVDSRLDVSGQPRFPPKSAADAATFLPKAASTNEVSNMTSKSQADAQPAAAATAAVQPFPLCPRCRHPPPCLCSSLASAWERTNSSSNFLSNSAFADSRGSSSFGETRNSDVQAAGARNPVFSQAQPITTAPTATAISSPPASSSPASHSFASQSRGYPQFPDGLKYDPTGGVFNQAIYAAAARGASSSVSAAAATFPAVGQQFADFGSSAGRMFGTPAASTGYAGQQQQPQVAATEGSLMKSPELARTTSNYHSGPSTAVGHFMAGMQAAVDDSYRHQQQRYSNEYATQQQQQNIAASQSSMQAHTPQQTNVVAGYMSAQAPTLSLPDSFPPKCQTNPDYQFGNSLEPLLEPLLASANENVYFFMVEVGSEDEWKNATNPFRLDELFSLQKLPTLLHLDSVSPLCLAFVASFGECSRGRLPGTQLSPVAPRSWVLPSGHTPGGRNDRWAKSARAFGALYTSTPDNQRSNRPERWMALVARELAPYKVDIAAFSETRFSEQGQLEEGINDRLMSPTRLSGRQVRHHHQRLWFPNDGLPSQLPPQNTEAQMARQDPGHGSPGADWNPQCGDTPSGGSGRNGSFPMCVLCGVADWRTESQVAMAPAICGLYGTPTPWDPSQVWWHAQGRLRPRQPPASSLVSGLLDSVMTPEEIVR
ncbi:unnamed protein product [Schistocephalus solidus]|uniref:DUF953 domain-containing protein n=1 Tax=Schistocephalus solidus TaxID=70667 RepID=A0A183T525_SCHSO|nr:unnamed protein product [Schistocephalus solidus]